MPLTPGARLGHCNVSALIGEGGVGQVWQTTDPDLRPDRSPQAGHRYNWLILSRLWPSVQPPPSGNEHYHPPHSF